MTESRKPPFFLDSGADETFFNMELVNQVSVGQYLLPKALEASGLDGVLFDWTYCTKFPFDYISEGYI